MCDWFFMEFLVVVVFQGARCRALPAWPDERDKGFR